MFSIYSNSCPVTILQSQIINIMSIWSIYSECQKELSSSYSFPTPQKGTLDTTRNQTNVEDFHSQQGSSLTSSTSKSTEKVSTLFSSQSPSPSSLGAGVSPKQQPLSPVFIISLILCPCNCRRVVFLELISLALFLKFQLGCSTCCHGTRTSTKCKVGPAGDCLSYSPDKQQIPKWV